MVNVSGRNRFKYMATTKKTAKKSNAIPLMGNATTIAVGQVPCAVTGMATKIPTPLPPAEFRTGAFECIHKVYGITHATVNIFKIENVSICIGGDELFFTRKDEFAYATSPVIKREFLERLTGMQLAEYITAFIKTYPGWVNSAYDENR